MPPPSSSRSVLDDDGLETPEGTGIRRLLKQSYATPLPILSMFVLSITLLGEFLSANVSTPFILFMVKGFDEITSDAEIAFWTGILVSTFFLTQFLTAILWATIADKCGRRFVLVISLLGSAMCAICVRLLQGIFAGAVGVARSSVSLVTDPTNEARVYAILGFCLGLGGVSGAIVGEFYTLFAHYPYLLPCAVAALVTLIGALLFLGQVSMALTDSTLGAILGCFLDREGRPRETFRLIEAPDDLYTPIPEEESRTSNPLLDEDDRRSRADTIRKKARTAPPSHILRPGVKLDRTLTLQSSVSSRSRANHSLYGYLRRRRGSNMVINNRDSTTSDVSFAHRLLLANENAVTNIADLWVAAAMNVDDDDPFKSDGERDSEGEPDSIDVFGDAEASAPGCRISRLPSVASNSRASSILRSSAIRPPRLDYSPRRPSIIHQPSLQRLADAGTPTSRRFSAAFPAILSNPGVQTPPAVLDAQQLLMRSEGDPSMVSQLPVIIIIQYSLLALHTTTHDQVFLSDYAGGGLNLKAGDFAQLIALMCLAQIVYQFHLYPNIGPPHGSLSHLAMFRIGSALFIPAYLAVTFLRPFASPGDGSILNYAIITTALVVSTAVRYCGSTFGYTSVSILLNYMTPPNAVGLANGIAQSIVSLARCLGPVLGGYLWPISVQDKSTGYPLDFIVCAGVCALGILHSL
ncbi:hypothetical protein B0H11DRAFT_2171431 [Mycena galericulata]|nr:hypothetical protein B0H11DRAFT_2171431 [Mycena galericulata]